VAYQSADVWAHQELFKLDKHGRPTVVAGVPPDYFSKTGQLWGNPLYRWDAHEKTGFAWWIARLRHALKQADLVRIDHFRGFAAYWEVSASAPNAMNGQWKPCPGEKLFEAFEKAFPELPIIAEDLGVITPDVVELRDKFKLPACAFCNLRLVKGWLISIYRTTLYKTLSRIQELMIMIQRWLVEYRVRSREEICSRILGRRRGYDSVDMMHALSNRGQYCNFPASGRARTFQ